MVTTKSVFNLKKDGYYKVTNIPNFKHLNTSFCFKDAPVSRQLGFQDPASPAMEGIIDLHHEIMFFIVLIIVFVFYMMAIIILEFNIKSKGVNSSKIQHNKQLE